MLQMSDLMSHFRTVYDCVQPDSAVKCAGPHMGEHIAGCKTNSSAVATVKTFL